MYSTKNSVGVIIATGNVGSYLSNRKDESMSSFAPEYDRDWEPIKKRIGGFRVALSFPDTRIGESDLTMDIGS